MTLEKLHDVAVAHLDPRPSNFIIKDDNSAIIIDFGFSKRTKNQRTFEEDFEIFEEKFKPYKKSD